MTKPFIYPFILFAVLACAGACRKKGQQPTPKFTGCRVSQIYETGQDTTLKTRYSFYYNADGTMQRIYVFNTEDPQHPYNIYFTYRSNYILVTQLPVGQISAFPSDSLITDAQNRVRAIYHLDYSFTVHDSQWDGYFYDSTGNMTLHTTHSGSGSTTDTFRWQNGDLVWYSEDVAAGWGVNIYNYTYSDTLYNTGNITARLDDLEKYGRMVYTPRHLWTHSILTTPYTVTMNYTYTLDSAGKVTVMKEAPTDSVALYYKTSRITYSCE